ncbi:MAG: MFS transporter [Chloroflexi bacterium]|nr:MFS transporter [Chloroflexota bacterium]
MPGAIRVQGIVIFILHVHDALSIGATALSRASRIPRVRVFDAWSTYRDFRFLWVGNFFANNAQWLQLLTLGWLMARLTEGEPNSALLVVSIGGINTLPGLLVGPWGGVLGDRVDRRKLIMSIQGFMAVFAFGFALLVYADAVQVWHVYGYALVSGACLSVTQPMRQALIANTVAPAAIPNAYATNTLTIPGTRMIGPFVGGILVATLGFFWNFTIESLLYVAMIVAYWPMKTPFTMKRRSTNVTGLRGVFSDLAEGFRFVWSGNRSLLFLILLTIVPNTVLQPVMFLLPVFTTEVLGRGAEVGGFLLATSGFGGFVMALMIASFGFVFRRGMVCLATAIISSIFVLALAQSVWLPMALVVIAMFSGSQTAIRTANGSLVQSLVPDELRARVTSIQRYGQGFVVGSSLLVGWLSGVFSIRIVMTALGILGLVIAIPFMILSRRLRELE